MRSRSRIRTDGRTVVLGRVRSARQLTPNHASNLPSTRRDCRSYLTPSGHAWTARSLTFYVLSYACADGRCHTAPPYIYGATPGVAYSMRICADMPGRPCPRPPHVMFLTRPSTRLAIFIACYVARAGKAWERGYCGLFISHMKTHTSHAHAHKPYRWHDDVIISRDLTRAIHYYVILPVQRLQSFLMHACLMLTS